MHLVEILLPVLDNQKRRLPRAIFKEVEAMLMAKFGGFTAFDRTPAKGMTENGGAQQRDEIIIFEVMVDKLDRSWWKRCRADLEVQFDQDEIVIRVHVVERL